MMDPICELSHSALELDTTNTPAAENSGSNAAALQILQDRQLSLAHSTTNEGSFLVSPNHPEPIYDH